MPLCYCALYESSVKIVYLEAKDFKCNYSSRAEQATKRSIKAISRKFMTILLNIRMSLQGTTWIHFDDSLQRTSIPITLTREIL